LIIDAGGHGVWWPLWTSNPVRLLTKGLGGFDSHILPPFLSEAAFKSPLIVQGGRGVNIAKMKLEAASAIAALIFDPV